MIIACPACGTRYLVPDNAIGSSGRRVRCAACRHSWFQDGEPAAEADVPVPVPAPARAERPMADVPAGEAAYPDPFAPVPPFRPRRNPARLWGWVAITIAVIACAAIAALLSFGPPAHLGLGGRGSSPITVTADPQVRKQIMASGSEVLAFSGRIANPTGKTQHVPDIRAELRDAGGRVVYGWTIAAPVPRLAPGASYHFSGAELDVPKSAASIHLMPADPSGAR